MFWRLLDDAVGRISDPLVDEFDDVEERRDRVSVGTMSGTVPFYTDTKTPLYNLLFSLSLDLWPYGTAYSFTPNCFVPALSTCFEFVFS